MSDRSWKCVEGGEVTGIKKKDDKRMIITSFFLHED